MSEELNNETNEEVAKTEEVIVEAPKVEEEPVVEPAPVVEEAPVVEPVIVTPEPATEVAGLGPVGDGAMGSTTMKKTPKPAAPKKVETKDDTVALFSTKNVSWQGVGKVVRGFNVVSKDAADKWLTRDHVRLVTPEELAGAYGK